MREFFQGWRRLASLALLALALPLIGVWIRSDISHDIVLIEDSRSLHTIESLYGRLSWERFIRDNHEFETPFHWHSRVAQLDRPSALENYGAEPQWRWLGFEFGTTSPELPSDNHRIGWWIIPYWSLALPLILLAGWLLLIKPRPAKSAKEPSHA